MSTTGRSIDTNETFHALNELVEQFGANSTIGQSADHCRMELAKANDQVLLVLKDIHAFFDDLDDRISDAKMTEGYGVTGGE